MSWGRDSTIVRSANLAAQKMTEGWVASKALRGAAVRGVCRHNLNGCLTSISLKNPLDRRGRIVVATTVRAAEWGRSASCGENRRRKGDELRQFPQILGGGGQ